MRSRKFDSLSIPSLLAAVIFTSLSIGTTFALFTDSSEATINISSGYVGITANLREYEQYAKTEDDITYIPELLTYSALEDPDGDLVDENDAHYRYELQDFTTYNDEIATYCFSENGFATYVADPGIIHLVHMIPGDMVKFQYNVTNNSNVAVKYRFRYEVFGDDTLLAKALNTKIMQGTSAEIDDGTAQTGVYDGLKTYMSAWQVYAPETNPNSVGFEIAIPIAAGNDYQDKECSVIITFEAVQGNAATPEGETVEYISD